MLWQATNPTLLWDLLPGEQKVQAGLLLLMLLHIYCEEPWSSISCSNREGRPGAKHPHQEGMSQRNHLEESDSSEQKKTLTSGNHRTSLIG